MLLFKNNLPSSFFFKYSKNILKSYDKIHSDRLISRLDVIKISPNCSKDVCKLEPVEREFNDIRNNFFPFPPFPSPPLSFFFFQIRS